MIKGINIINQDSGYLMIDIANAIAEENNDITLITGRLVERDKPLSCAVRVKRIIEYKRNSTFRRILSWSIGFLQILYIIKTRHRKDYLLIITNPPLASFLPLFCSNRFSLLIFDVYPDALTQMGIIAVKSLISRIWRNNNRKVFARADNIFTLTESMSALLKEYSGDKEISVVPVWGNNEFFKPIRKQLNPFVAEHNLKNRFIVLYSGNHGATHNVEVIAELAEKVKNPEILFLIIGDGDRKKRLEEKVMKMGLNNCLFLPYQSVDRIPYSFAAADLAIVSLGTMASGLSLPSKIFSYMSAGLPLLCIAGEDSELNNLVNKYGNGRCLTPEKLDEMAAFIEEMALKNDLYERYKANSIKASHDFTSENARIIADAIIHASDQD